MKTLHRALCVALSFGATSSCADERPQGPPPAEQSEPAPSTVDLSELRGLGYVDFSDEEDWSTVDGLVIHDPSRAYAGYTFYVDIPSSRGFLVDMEGVERASWALSGSRQWNRGLILDNGDLLAVGVSDDDFLRSLPKADGERPPAGFLSRLSWSGEVLWQKQIAAHHDVRMTPQGNILVLGESRRLTEIHPDCGVIDNGVILLTPEGELVDEVSSYDLLRSAPSLNRFVEHRDEEKCGRGYPNDCLHLNCARWLNNSELAGAHPIYEPGNVIITSRKQHTVAIFNYARRELLWAWGRGTILFPHEAQVLDNGNILLLDNGAPKRREHSRIIELDPIKEKIVWSYVADPPESFYTIGRGTVQRLPNGNTLISSSGQGQIFEVTREREVVWRYHNPYFDERKKTKTRGTLRAERYPVELIEPLLEAAAARNDR